MSVLARFGGWLVDKIAPLDEYPQPSLLDAENGVGRDVSGSTTPTASTMPRGGDEL